jgi:hypothetical protein
MDDKVIAYLLEEHVDIRVIYGTYIVYDHCLVDDDIKRLMGTYSLLVDTLSTKNYDIPLIRYQMAPEYNETIRSLMEIKLL